jgi:hypothetical protein
VFVQRRSEEMWYEMQDLHVAEMQIYEKHQWFDRYISCCVLISISALDYSCLV